MRRRRHLAAAAACLAGLAVWPAAALADHDDRVNFRLQGVGHSPNPASFLQDPEGPAPAEVNTDIAFWGDLAFNGNYDGFRIINIADPRNPREISHARCQGNQGDVVVWNTILVRSWNSPAEAGATCDGDPVAQGFEGLHVFDISNPADPDLVASVETPCGSHTATGVPDVANGRLLVYNQGAGALCRFLDIVEVPLANAAGPGSCASRRSRARAGVTTRASSSATRT
jgi:hypothetical protein